MKHIIQALVENKFGVLSRVASLFSARGYNIDSLAVGETNDPTVSCMTIVVNAADERILEQIKKQLHKLIDVITVADFTRKDHLDRELILVKAAMRSEDKETVNGLVKNYPVKLVEENNDQIILEICAGHDELDGIFRELEKLSVKELVRTGKIAISK